jgi:phenylacetate-CoA ligase
MYAYVETLNKFRPEWLHGYPSTLGILAAFMNENGLKLDYPLKWVTTGAESLLEHQKTAILKAFGLNPIQHYGNAEAVANISQGRNGHLSVDEDFSFVEFLPTGDGVYKIIGTNFTNYATPFIRYDTKDNVTLEEKANIHGKARFISQIDGRIEDYIVLNDGTMLGRLDHIFKDMVRIREAQIVQNRPGQIEIKVVKGINYETGDENLLIKEIEKRCEEKICFTITYVENLLKTQSGKLRFVQRRLQ